MTHFWQGGTCPASTSIKTTKGILHHSSGTSGASSLPLSRIRGSLLGGSCDREGHQPSQLALPCIPVLRICWRLLWGKARLRTALGQPPCLSRATPWLPGRAWTCCRMSRKSRSLGEVCEAQVTPAPGSGGLPRAPQDLPHLPRGDDQPKGVEHSHPPFPTVFDTLRVKAVTADVLRVVLQTSPGPQDSSLGAAQVWGLLPHEGKQPQAQSQPPAKSWAHHCCALGKCPAAPLMDMPFLHHLRLLGTQTSILRLKTVTSSSHFLQFLTCGEAPGLLSGDP